MMRVVLKMVDFADNIGLQYATGPGGGGGSGGCVFRLRCGVQRLCGGAGVRYGDRAAARNGGAQDDLRTG